MKKFIKAVGQIDEEVLERYEAIEKSLVPKRKHSYFLKITAIAACFCLIFGSVFAVLRFTGETELPFYSDTTSKNQGFESSNSENESSGVVSGAVSNSEQSDVSDNESSNSEVSNDESSKPEKPPFVQNDPSISVSDEPLWLNPSISGGAEGGGGQLAEPTPPYVLFGMGMTAMGRVTQILPDTYARLGASSAELRYRVIVMEITESVYGKNLPSEIYLTVPTYLDVNALLNYDEILFAFKQKGFESYVLANETQKRAEAFPMMFESIPGYHEFCFVPFTDGVFDISLWREKGFNNQFYFQEEYMYEFFTNPGEYQVQIGYTLGQAKKAILDTYAEMRYPPLDRVLYSDIFNSDAAKAVLEYCTPFKNGIFAQDAVVQNGSAIFFERYIYGFPTNEVIRIRESDENATYYGERFTEEEIERLPNIADFFERTDIYSLSPMHTEITDKLTVNKPVVSGKYVKFGGKIYSIARVAWKIVDDRNWYCLDDTYFLISEDGSATLIDREELRKLTGDDYFVTSFEYNKYVEEIAIAE